MKTYCISLPESDDRKKHHYFNDGVALIDSHNGGNRKAFILGELTFKDD